MAPFLVTKWKGSFSVAGEFKLEGEIKAEERFWLQTGLQQRWKYKAEGARHRARPLLGKTFFFLPPFEEELHQAVPLRMSHIYKQTASKRRRCHLCDEWTLISGGKRVEHVVSRRQFAFNMFGCLIPSFLGAKSHHCECRRLWRGCFNL